MLRKKDATITWVSGADLCETPEFEVYLRSLSMCGFSGDKLIFTHDMPEAHRTRVEGYGFRVIPIAPTLVRLPVRDRFLGYWHYLANAADSYRFIIHTDARDVVFQRNPVEWIERCYGGKSEFVVLASEGMVHEVSPWNMQDQYNLQLQVKHFIQDFRRWPVISGGIQIGTPNRVKDLMFNLWSTTLISDQSCTDQAALNFLSSFLRIDPTVHIVEPKSCPLVLTGEPVKYNLMQPPPVMKDGEVMSPELGQVYYLFHQWDRTTFRKEIFERYGVADPRGETIAASSTVPG